MMITSADFLPLLPEIFLLSATCALLLTDLFISPARRGWCISRRWQSWP